MYHNNNGKAEKKIYYLVKIINGENSSKLNPFSTLYL